MKDGIWLDGRVVGPIQTNCYLVGNARTNEAVIVDPGDHARLLLDMIKKREAAPAAIYLTHGHYDHILAVGDLLNCYPGLPVVISKKERPMVEDQTLNSGIGGYDCRIEPTHWAEDGEVLTYAGLSFKVLATPGHTGGSCCYYLEEEKLLLSGDTLFYQGYGRCDLPTGSVEEMRTSLERLLTTLPEDVRVLPGHGSETTIGYEKRIEGFED